MKVTITATTFDRIVDILKFFAGISIYYYHFFRALGPKNLMQWHFSPWVLPDIILTWSWAPTQVTKVLFQNFGYLGLTIFIMASGWSLTRSYLKKKGDVSYGGDYFRKRLLRILPLYGAALVTSLLFAWFRNEEHGKTLSRFLLSGVLLHTILPGSFFSVNAAFWFLPTLLVLYMLFPFLFRQFMKHPHRTLGIVAGVAYANALLIWFTPLHTAHPYLLMGGWPLVKVFEFGFGIWLAVLCSRITVEYTARHYWLLAFLGVVLCVVGLSGLQLWWVYIQHPILLTLGILSILAYPLFFVATTKQVGNALAFLGRYSYGLFLFHSPIIYWWIRVAPPAHLNSHPIFSATAVLILLVPVLIWLESRVRKFTFNT